MSLDFSVASERLNDTREIEIKIHGKPSQRSVYQKDVVRLVPSGVWVRA